MLKIWGRKNSSNVRKVLWCAEELGLDYQAIDAGGAFGVVDTPQYRALNPNGRVPMIEDGDFVLWESNTIVRYLCARHASDFYPNDLQARASAEKWMDWTTSTLADPFKAVFWGILRTSADKQNWDSINAGRQACIDALTTVDQALAEQPYLSGQAFGMGDIPLGCFIYAWFEMPIERPAMPHLEAWYQRLQQRPAYRTAVMTALT
ncbi:MULTISPECIES: glutathione S-transferase family protein [Pseudomonas]|uniref:Glutathione S-transferase n=1 Tax=Pseudomonas azadiae TaxID=2843612 RepID=A0ABS6P2L4_9PSED|nr:MULTISPECIES: glutathione S-transferase [Pseudomonas]MBV4454708.1 glutathione S-transferase [Pseudomonas azadiae]NMF41240.1 glutathione S-transferase [Pseudomonas sp. SWRI 103]